MIIDLQTFPVLIRGAGDLATGVAIRLHRVGLAVILAEIARPLAVRRTVTFAQAVFDGECRVEEVRARRVLPDEISTTLAQGMIPVLVDAEVPVIDAFQPAVLIDAIMAKRNTGTRLGDAALVIALGPGFTVGVDCHAVIETNRGHNLGRVLWKGSAEPDTGAPGELPGVGRQPSRVLRSPAAGHVVGRHAIGDRVRSGAVIATIQANAADVAEVVAPLDGVLRGLIHPTVEVSPGMKIGDLDPRADPSYCFTVSDKSLAIGGGVLEAVFSQIIRIQHANRRGN
jgi:xanthine dehydrogenase accessory factor